MENHTIESPCASQTETPENRWHFTLPNVLIAAIWLISFFDWVCRDSIPQLAFVFYATPPIVIAFLSLSLTSLTVILRYRSGLLIQRKTRTIYWATAVLGVACLLNWITGNFRIPSFSKSRPEAIKVVFWNIAHGQFSSRKQIARYVRDFQADVVALSEIGSDREPVREFWEAQLLGYSAHPLEAGMILLVKGHAIEKFAGSLGGSGDYTRLAVETRGVPFDIIMADLKSDPFRSREEPLTTLFGVMRNQEDVPTIVLGDFNTPPSSVWFDAWRANWNRAWEIAGNGYEPTWPQPFPVLALDHVWGNHAIKFTSCINGWTRFSDHRPVVVEFTLALPE